MSIKLELYIFECKTNQSDSYEKDIFYNKVKRKKSQKVEI